MQKTPQYRLWNGSLMEEVAQIVFHTDGSCHVNGEYPVNDKAAQDKFGKLPYALMLYSNLVDKNGRRICEGDIVRVSKATYRDFLAYGPLGDLEAQVSEPLYLISWNEHKYGFYKHKLYNLRKFIGRKMTSIEDGQGSVIDVEAAKHLEYGTHLWLIEDDKELEVVGNQFENPELLEPLSDEEAQ